MVSAQKDCSRCGALLAEDEGICPTCGTVFGNRTEFQMPQVTPAMMEAEAEEAATMAMPVYQDPVDQGSDDEAGEAATIAMAAIPAFDDPEAATIAMATIPDPPKEEEEAATVMLTTIPDDYPGVGASTPAGPPPGAGRAPSPAPGAPVFAGPIHYGSDDEDERNIPGMIVGAIVLVAILALLGWLFFG